MEGIYALLLEDVLKRAMDESDLLHVDFYLVRLIGLSGM